MRSLHFAVSPRPKRRLPPFRATPAAIVPNAWSSIRDGVSLSRSIRSRPRRRSQLPRRVLLVGSVGSLAAVFAAGSLAWACTPQATFGLSTDIGPPGTNVTATGASFYGSPVELRWGSSTGPVLATATGPSFTASFKVPSAAPGYYTIVAQGVDGIGTARSGFEITAPPSASFTATPNPAQTWQSVSFDGSASSADGPPFDADGTIAKYEWDLDGDGFYETNSGRTPTTARVYTTPGVRTVRLRVTDTYGVTGETRLALRIDARPDSVIAPALAALPLPPSFAASKKTITVSKGGRFSYSFVAEPGLTAKINLRSIKKVGAQGRISLGTKVYTVPGSGIVKVSWKLSRKNLRTLNRTRRIRFRVTVTLGSAAGLSRSNAMTLTLKKPTR